MQHLRRDFFVGTLDLQGFTIRIVRELGRSGRRLFVARSVASAAKFYWPSNAVRELISDDLKFKVEGAAAAKIMGDPQVAHVWIVALTGVEQLLLRPRTRHVEHRKRLFGLLKQIVAGASPSPVLPSDNSKKAGLRSSSDIGDEFGLSGQSVHRFLQQRGVIFPVRQFGEIVWSPTSEYSQKRFMNHIVAARHGKAFACGLWTPRGAEFVRKILIESGFRRVMK